MYKRYRDKVEFYVVYIREAHPTDGWQVGANEREGVLFSQPTEFGQRTDIAHQMCRKLELSIPTIIDGMDNKVNEAYSAEPDRLYLVDAQGRVAYKSGPGPFGFKPEELTAAIVKLLDSDGAAAGAVR